MLNLSKQCVYDVYLKKPVNFFIYFFPSPKKKKKKRVKLLLEGKEVCIIYSKALLGDEEFVSFYC